MSDCEKCGKDLDEHPMIDVSNVKVLQMCDRHPKWQRVEPGHVIPAGQPYRVEYPEMSPEHYGRNVAAIDHDGNSETTGAFKPIHHGDYVETSRWFVDSSWRPPLVLPTKPCVIRAKLKLGGPRILFGHPNPGEDSGMTFCRDVDGLGYRADEIESFEVLWTEGERGKDVLVSWEAIDKLKKAYPSNPGAVCSPVDYFLREVVGDR